MRGTIRRHYRALIRTAVLPYLFLFCTAVLQSFFEAEEMRKDFHLPPWMTRILTVIGTDGMPVLMIFDRDAESGREIQPTSHMVHVELE